MPALQTPETIQSQLALLKVNLEQPYPGYPARQDRLVRPLGCLLLIDDQKGSASETSPFEYPDEAEQRKLHDAGYSLDSYGRPVHPWFDYMVSDPDVGVVTGKGTYWNWGPNYTADPIVIHDGHILMVQRGDNGMLALPGGYINGPEDPYTAARREAREETGVQLLPSDLVTEVYRGPVVDPRMTANAWPETTAVLFHPAERAEPHADDDAVKADWLPIKDVEDRVLFGSHRFLINLALGR